MMNSLVLDAIVIPPPSSSSSTKVRLELYASQLPNVAGAFKGTSDPYAVVTILTSNNNPQDKDRVLGKTEVVKNSLSPKWTTCFDLDYELGSLQRVHINIRIYDETPKSKINAPMGSADFEVGEVLGTRGCTKAKNLRRGGTIFCRITPAPMAAAGILRLTLAGSGLKNMAGAFGKSDPFYEVSANISAAGGITWQPVYRSEHVDNNLNPVWKPAVLDMGRLCEGDIHKAIQITVWDWHKSGKHENMGMCETSVAALMADMISNRSSLRVHILRGKETGKLLVGNCTLHTSIPSSSERLSGMHTRRTGSSVIITILIIIIIILIIFCKAQTVLEPSFVLVATDTCAKQ